MLKYTCRDIDAGTKYFLKCPYLFAVPSHSHLQYKWTFKNPGEQF